MPLVLKTISDSSDAQRDLGKLKSSVKDVELQAKSTGDALANMIKSAASFIAVGLATNSLFKLSDAFTGLENKIRTVTDSQKQFNIAFSGVSDIALKTRNDLDAVATLYSKIALNSKQLGVNQRDTLKVTETVSKAIKLSGATAAEQSAVLLQFGQSVASGSFSGDELRSIREGAPILAKLMADIFKVPLGDLKKLGEQGKLLAGPVLEGLAKGAGEIDNKFAALGVTFGDAFNNLGTSFSLLMYEAKKTFLGSGNPIATWINDIALRIGNIAKYFQFYMALSKAYVLEFIFDSMDAFRAFWAMLVPIGKKVSEIAKSLFEEWKPSLTAAVGGMTVFATAAASTVVDTFHSVLKYLSGSSLVKTITESFSVLASDVTSVIKNVFNKLNIQLPSMNFKAIFADLAPILTFVKTWANNIYDSFYQLYDKLVGHSIVPDLIKGISAWFGKLMGSPAKDVTSFVEHTVKKFGLISLAAPFTLGLKLITSYKKQLLAVAAILATVGLGIGISKRMSGDKELTSGVTSRVGGFIEGLRDQLSKITDKLVDMFNKSDFGHNLKQALGIKDTVEGTVSGVRIDTSKEARVGRGPQRLNDRRDFGHDILNMFPTNWQVPILAGLTGVISLAVIAAFQAGTVRSVILSVISTAFLLATARLVQDSAVKKSFYDLAYFFTDKIKFLLDKVLGGNAIKDPLGLLSIIAKTMLLFKAGRAFLGNTAANIATSPTRSALNVSTIAEKKYVDFRANNLGKDIASLPQRLNDTFLKTQKQSIQQLAALSIVKDSSGKEIGRRAQDVIKANDATIFGPQAKNAANQALAAHTRMLDAQKANANATKALADLQKAQDGFKAKSDALGEQLKNTREAMVQGIKNFSAGVGGVIGGVAGYQFGATLAEGMTNAPAWAKLAVTLGSAVAGQFLGSLVGLGFAAILTNIFKIGAYAFTAIVGPVLALTSPWILGAAIITTALVAGYMLFTSLPDVWQKKIKSALTAAPGSAGEGYKATGGTELAVLQAQDVASKMPQSEIEANLQTNRDFIAAVSRLSETLGKITNWLIGQDPVKRATGGWINGPGTSTSDSIPALLSKGEYVVNAKSAAAYGSVLSAINNGSGIAMLAGGGPASGDEIRLMRSSKGTNGAVKVEVTNSTDFFSSIKDVFRNDSGNIDMTSIFAKVMETFKKMFSPEVAKVPGVVTASAPKTLEEQVKSAKTMTASMEILANAMNQAGFKDVKGKDLINLSPESASSLAEAIGKQLSFIRRSKDNSVTEFERSAASKGARDLQEAIDNLVYKLQLSGEAPSTFGRGEPVDLDKAELTLADQFKIISDNIPGLGISIEEFRSATDSVREAMFKEARGIASREAQIANVPIGTATKPVPYKSEGLAARFAQLDQDKKDAAARFAPQLNQFRIPVKEIKQYFEKFGMSIQAEAVNMLTEADLGDLRQVAAEMERAFEITTAKIGDKSVTPIMRQRAQDFILDQQLNINNLFAEAMSRSGMKYKTTSDTLRMFGLEIEKSLFYRLSDMERRAIQGTIRQLNDLNTVISSDAASPDIKARAQRMVDEIAEEFGAALKESASPRSQQYGKQFVDEQKEGFSRAISDALKGKSKDGKSAWKVLGNTILDNFTSGVIDVFVKGLADNVFVKPLTSLMKDLGANLSKIFGNGDTVDLAQVGQKSSSGVGDLIKNAGASSKFGKFDPSAETPVTVDMSTPSSEPSIADSLSQAFQPMKDALMNVWNTLLQMLGISTTDSGLNKITAVSTQTQNALTTTGDQAIVSAILGASTASSASSAAAVVAATGGYISGAGTGTSDSIAAMLSNGEYVVNAAATSKFLPLLSAINSGNVQGFADGGLVMPTNVGSMSAIKRPAAGSGNTQSIYLSVTGDISRQTRSEIYGMLPQIAQGVNTFNKDKGYKG